MSPKKKKSSGHQPKSPDPPPASDPSPTTTSSATSACPGGTATASSLLPSSALPSGPPTIATTTTTTTTQPVQPAPLPPPSSSAPPLSIQETHQERISGTLEGRTTTTAPSALAASTSTRSVDSVLPIIEDLMFRIVPEFVSSMVAMQSKKKSVIERLNEIVSVIGSGSHLGPTDSDLETFRGLVEKELKAASDSLHNMEKLQAGAEAAVAKLLAEKNSRDGSGDYSCGDSKREGGGPDSGSGGGDAEGGGVCV